MIALTGGVCLIRACQFAAFRGPLTAFTTGTETRKNTKFRDVRLTLREYVKVIEIAEIKRIRKRTIIQLSESLQLAKTKLNESENNPELNGPQSMTKRLPAHCFTDEMLIQLN